MLQSPMAGHRSCPRCSRSDSKPIDPSRAKCGSTTSLSTRNTSAAPRRSDQHA
jgi:hypothetical protein